jgi:hypothetical protein
LAYEALEGAAGRLVGLNQKAADGLPQGPKLELTRLRLRPTRRVVAGKAPLLTEIRWARAQTALVGVVISTAYRKLKGDCYSPGDSEG